VGLKKEGARPGRGLRKKTAKNRKTPKKQMARCYVKRGRGTRKTKNAPRGQDESKHNPGRSAFRMEN